MKPLDWRGILERAGADENAPEGSQGRSLFLLSAAIGNLVVTLGSGLVSGNRIYFENERELREAVAALNSGATP